MRDFKKNITFLTVILLTACQPTNDDVFAFEGLKLGDSYAKVKEKYADINCIKDKVFNCSLKDSEGGVRFSFDIGEKIISIEHYWVSDEMNFGQIIKAYKDKFGSPTKTINYDWGYNSDYVWCKDKECNLYRSLTFNSPKEGKCTPLSSDEFYEHSRCKDTSLSYFTVLADKNSDNTWYDKKNSNIKNIK